MKSIKRKLREQLKIEQKSVKLYSSFIRKIKNSGIKRKIAGIRDDEKEHVLLVKKMISFLK